MLYVYDYNSRTAQNYIGDTDNNFIYGDGNTLDSGDIAVGSLYYGAFDTLENLYATALQSSLFTIKVLAPYRLSFLNYSHNGPVVASI